MKSKNILVTGGAGFIGSHLVDELLGTDFNVSVLDNLSNGSLSNLEKALKNKRFKFIKGNILNNPDCFAATRNQDIVFHLACLGVRHSIHSPFDNHRVNAEGTLKMLNASLKNKIKKFYYISSSEIYGEVKNFPISEENIPKPTTVYGASKLTGELYSSVFYKCYGLDTTILRIFNNFGPRSHFENDAGEIIPRTIVMALYNKSPVVFGNGNITRDYFYVKDTARALVDLIRLPNIKNEIINIGTGKETKINDIIKMILKLMGKNNLKIVHVDGRPADLPRLWVNAHKFRKLTDFKSCFDFESGLKETIKYFEELSKQKNLYKKIKIINWKK